MKLAGLAILSALALALAGCAAAPAGPVSRVIDITNSSTRAPASPSP